MPCRPSSRSCSGNKAGLPACVAVWLLAGAACSGPPPQTEAATHRRPGIAPAGSGITGVLQDEAGDPIAGARVLACMTTVCLSGQTAADGRFAFEIDAPAAVAIKTDADLEALPRRAAALHPVRLVDARLIDIGAVRSPRLPEGAPLGPARNDPQMVEAGDGLVLTLNRGDLTPKPGDALVDVAARRLDRVPASISSALPGETVLTVYALHPFGARSTTPIAVRAPIALADGTAVSFRTISEIDGSFSEPVAGRAAGGHVSTDRSRGIRELTYLVISNPSSLIPESLIPHP